MLITSLLYFLSIYILNCKNKNKIKINQKLQHITKDKQY